MPIPLAVAAGLGLVSTGMGIYDTIKGGQQRREAEKASEKFATDIKNLRAKNLMEGIGIPMRGFDLAKEAQAQRYATGVAALQSAGAEGVLGGLTGLERQQGQQDLALAAQLEKMEYARNLERARQAQAIENQATGREAQLGFMRLQGAGQAAAEGAQRQQAGVQSIIGGLGTAAELGLKYSPLYGKDKVDPAAMTGMVNIGGDTSQTSRVGRPPIYSGLGPFQPGMNPMSQPLSQTYTGPFPLHSLGAVSTGLDYTPMGGQEISLGGGLAPSALTTPYYWNPWNPG